MASGSSGQQSQLAGMLHSMSEDEARLWLLYAALALQGNISSVFPTQPSSREVVCGLAKASAGYALVSSHTGSHSICGAPLHSCPNRV